MMKLVKILTITGIYLSALSCGIFLYSRFLGHEDYRVHVEGA